MTGLWAPWKNPQPTWLGYGFSVGKTHNPPGWAMIFYIGKTIAHLVGHWVSYGKTHNPLGWIVGFLWKRVGVLFRYCLVLFVFLWFSAQWACESISRSVSQPASQSVGRERAVSPSVSQPSGQSVSRSASQSGCTFVRRCHRFPILRVRKCPARKQQVSDILD